MNRICNTYSYGDIVVGMTEQFECRVTDEMQEYFMNLSGDTNPMHTDANFAMRGGGIRINLYMVC